MTNTRDTNYEISKIHIAMETEIQREIKKCKLTIYYKMKISKYQEEKVICRKTKKTTYQYKK